MIKKNTAITSFPVGVFIATADGSEVTTGTPTGTYRADGNSGTIVGAVTYDATAKSWWGSLTATETNGDLCSYTFNLDGCLPINITVSTTPKLIGELNDLAATAIVNGGPIATAAGAVSINLSQTGLTPRALDGVADGDLAVGDALVAAISGAAGKESKTGTAYTVKTPSTGTTIRSFTLDDAVNPSSRS